MCDYYMCHMHDCIQVLHNFHMIMYVVSHDSHLIMYVYVTCSMQGVTITQQGSFMRL